QHQFATLKEKSEWGMAYFSLHSPISTQTPFSESKVLLPQAQLTEANLAFSKMFHTTAKKNAKLDDFLIGKPDALLLEFFSQGYVLKEKEFLLLDGQGIRRYVKGGLIGIVENAHLVGCWLTVIDITEQKVSEQYYRQMTESASNMMTLLDKENRIVFDNDAVLHTLGFDKTARLNQTILHYVHPDDTDLLQALLKRTWQQLMPSDFAGLRFRAKDNSYITGDGALVPIKRNDVFNGILLEFRVNQERNLLEKTLFNEVRFFKGIAEAIDEVIVLLDKEGNILYDNQAIERIFGYKSSLRIGRYGFEYIHSDDIQEVSQLFRLALGNPHVHYQKEILFLHAQGEWKNVVIHLQNELDNENINGVILRIAEQTEQIQARNSQERENEIFKSLVQYSPNTYLILDEKATIKFGSEEVKRSLGYHPQELEGRNFLKLVHPHNKNAVLDNFRLLQSSPDSKVEFQVNIQHDNGEWRTMQIVGKWMTKNETFLGILLEMSDVSQTFQRLNSLQEQLAFYQALNDSSGCLILLLEPDGALLYANPMAERLLGLQAPASLKDYLHDEDWQTLSVVFEQLADNPTQRSYLKIRTATSQKYWAICTNASLRSTVKGILLELINGELFLEEEKPQPALKNWIVLPHTTLLELDHNENILSANGASEEIFGVENHRLLQLPIYQFLDTSSHEIFRKSLTDARQLLASSGADKQIRPLSFFCLHPSGEKTYVEAFLIVFLHETGCQLYLQNASDKYWQRKELINQRWINDRTQELVAVVEE
ncbi:MAG: PAS domain S-box protein, partial [Flammeovirgaceae bacterium]|nr:PAS domain S-box protein [Flammeovirgaceae bacterium]MDW8287880.1 PAS domain S-box protein [Flammeovirgaceae bacterium]